MLVRLLAAQERLNICHKLPHLRLKGSLRVPVQRVTLHGFVAEQVLTAALEARPDVRWGLLHKSHQCAPKPAVIKGQYHEQDIRERIDSVADDARGRVEQQLHELRADRIYQARNLSKLIREPEAA